MRTQSGGFTLIELMFAVVVLGVLVAVAVVAYTKNVRKARAGEIPQIFGELKMREDTFHMEKGYYLPLCPNPSDDGSNEDCAEGDYWPVTIAGGGDAVPATAPPARWQQIKVHLPSGQLYCQYEVIAGKANSAANVGVTGLLMFSAAPPRNWYYLMARCDWDNDDAVNATYWQRDDWTALGHDNDGR